MPQLLHYIKASRCWFRYTLLLSLFLYRLNAFAQMGPTGPNDTIPVLVYKINATDSFAFFYMNSIEVRGILTPEGKIAKKKLYLLRRYIENVYPLAIQATATLNQLNSELEVLNSRKEKRQLRKVTEVQLKDQFTKKIKNLCYAEGKVLCKLISRETKQSAYEIIKNYKNGINARVWQTVSFFFDGNLKAQYDPNGIDMEMEMIVREVARRYGRT